MKERQTEKQRERKSCNVVYNVGEKSSRFWYGTQNFEHLFLFSLFGAKVYLLIGDKLSNFFHLKRALSLLNRDCGSL